MTPLRRRAQRAFTLIELLVVVAVVGFLLGILLPVLGRARSAGRAVECASAIRQLALANDLYAHDHDDRYMPGASEIQTTNLHRWHGVRDSTGAPFRARGGPIGRYLEGAEEAVIGACPEFAPTLDSLAQRGAGFERGCGGYGYNQAFVGAERHEIAKGVWEVRSDRQGSKRSRFNAPAMTIGFADAAIAAEEVIEYSFVEPPVWPQWPPFRPEPSTHFRHRSRANVAWLDGHVSAETMTHSESSGIYPLEARHVGIGWAGEASDNQLYDYH